MNNNIILCTMEFVKARKDWAAWERYGSSRSKTTVFGGITLNNCVIFIHICMFFMFSLGLWLSRNLMAWFFGLNSARFQKIPRPCIHHNFIPCIVLWLRHKINATALNPTSTQYYKRDEGRNNKKFTDELLTPGMQDVLVTYCVCSLLATSADGIPNEHTY